MSCCVSLTCFFFMYFGPVCDDRSRIPPQPLLFRPLHRAYSQRWIFGTWVPPVCCLLGRGHDVTHDAASHSAAQRRHRHVSSSQYLILPPSCYTPPPPVTLWKVTADQQH